MKVFHSALVAAALMLSAAPAVAEDLDFPLTNGTSTAMTGFYVSPASTDSWEENLLEGTSLASGETVSVMIMDGRTTCIYDIMAEFSDGGESTDHDIDLCELGAYEVTE